MYSIALFLGKVKYFVKFFRCERATGIEPASPAWKASIISHYTTPACLFSKESLKQYRDKINFFRAAGKLTPLRSLKPCGFNASAAGKLPFSRPLSHFDSGCWESNPVNMLPKHAYCRYTTARHLLAVLRLAMRDWCYHYTVDR
jgi:hypothetical protein